MKTDLLPRFLAVFLFLLPTSTVLAAPKGKVTILKLDTEKSKVEYQGKVMTFASGQFRVLKGEAKSGELELKEPSIKFQIHKWTEVHNFAPGSPNLWLSGIVTPKGGKPVFKQVKLFYKPTAKGFEIQGKVPVQGTTEANVFIESRT